MSPERTESAREVVLSAVIRPMTVCDVLADDDGEAGGDEALVWARAVPATKMVGAVPHKIELLRYFMRPFLRKMSECLQHYLGRM